MTTRGELYVDEYCRDMFQKELDNEFGNGTWKLDGSPFQVPMEAQLDKIIEVPILDFEKNTLLGTAIIINHFFIEGEGADRYIDVVPKSIKIEKI